MPGIETHVVELVRDGALGRSARSAGPAGGRRFREVDQIAGEAGDAVLHREGVRVLSGYPEEEHLGFSRAPPIERTGGNLPGPAELLALEVLHSSRGGVSVQASRSDDDPAHLGGLFFCRRVREGGAEERGGGDGVGIEALDDVPGGSRCMGVSETAGRAEQRLLLAPSDCLSLVAAVDRASLVRCFAQRQDPGLTLGRSSAQGT